MSKYYPETPDSFPRPGTPEFTDVMGHHLLGLWDGLRQEHTETQTEKSVSFLMGNLMERDGQKGIGMVMLGRTEPMIGVLRSTLREVVVAHLRSKGLAETEENFIAEAMSFMADLSIKVVGEWVASQKSDAKREVIHEASQYGLKDDSEINQ